MSICFDNFGLRRNYSLQKSLILGVYFERLLFLERILSGRRMKQRFVHLLIWDIWFTFIDFIESLVKLVILSSDLDAFSQFIVAKIDSSIISIFLIETYVAIINSVSSRWQIEVDGDAVFSDIFEALLVTIVFSNKIGRIIVS